MLTPHSKNFRDLLRAESVHESGPSDGDGNAGGTVVNMVLLFWKGVFMVVISGMAFHYFYKWIVIEWIETRALVSTVAGAVRVAIVMCVAAFLFFWFRAKRPFLYGCVEIGAAIITTYDFCIQASAKNLDAYHWLLALLGSVYIGVRGLDNINKVANIFPGKKEQTKATPR